LTLPALSLTEYVPGVENVCAGLRSREPFAAPDDASPKSHCQPVGEFVDVSVNETAAPAAGADGEKVKPADGDAETAAVPYRNCIAWTSSACGASGLDAGTEDVITAALQSDADVVVWMLWSWLGWPRPSTCPISCITAVLNVRAE
jgi:hypothetical protein